MLGPKASLRDQFAMTALTGLLSGYYQNSTSHRFREAAYEAYALADAMLAARDAFQFAAPLEDAPGGDEGASRRSAPK